MHKMFSRFSLFKLDSSDEEVSDGENSFTLSDDSDEEIIHQAAQKSEENGNFYSLASKLSRSCSQKRYSSLKAFGF